jgi:predicted acyl esterase
MRMRVLVGLLAVSLPCVAALGQGRNTNMTAEQRAKMIAQREDVEKQLEAVAIIDRKVMVTMRDGKKMQADIYRPKDTTKKYPIIFSRTPYNFNYWDVKSGTYRDMSTELDAVKRGYALVEMNERGHFFSQGEYDILGPPLTDADDEFNWMARQEWASGKIGLIGCSSAAEWQLAAVALNNKALTTFIPQSFGAGVGKVGPYNEQGNWYRGGAVQMLFIDCYTASRIRRAHSFRPT